MTAGRGTTQATQAGLLTGCPCNMAQHDGLK